MHDLDNAIKKHEDIYERADRYRIPLSVTIELNTTCNLRCEHCYIPAWTNPGLRDEDLYRVLAELRELGTFEIVLTGGEIFSRRNAMQIIETIRRMGFELILFTNATRITPEMAKRLGELHVALVSATMFSLDPLIHDGITKRPGSLSKLLAAVDQLIKNSVPVQLKTIAMKKNYRSVPEMKKYCDERGISYLATPYLFPRADGSQDVLDMRLTGHEMVEMVRWYDEIISFMPVERKPTDLMCPPLLHSMAITAAGGVSACNTIFSDVGNVQEASVRELWDSEEIRRLQAITIGEVAGCEGCVLSSYCVRCAGNARTECGSLLDASPLACSVTRARVAGRKDGAGSISLSPTMFEGGEKSATHSDVVPPADTGS